MHRRAARSDDANVLFDREFDARRPPTDWYGAAEARAAPVIQSSDVPARGGFRRSRRAPPSRGMEFERFSS
jgi:hypothetical protein